MKELLKLSVILSALLLLINCSRPNPEVIIETRYIDRNIPIQSRPRGVNLNEVRFYVVTEENLQEFIDEFSAENGELVFVATSVRGYENTAINLAELRRYIEQQQQIIVYYENSATQ